MTLLWSMQKMRDGYFEVGEGGFTVRWKTTGVGNLEMARKPLIATLYLDDLGRLMQGSVQSHAAGDLAVGYLAANAVGGVEVIEIFEPLSPAADLFVLLAQSGFLQRETRFSPAAGNQNQRQALLLRS